MVAQESDLNDRHLFRCGVTIAAALFAPSGGCWTRCIGGIGRRIELRGGRIGGIYDDERTPGERCRCPFAEQHSFEPGIVLRGSLIVRVEYSMAIKKSVHGRRNANAAL